MSEEERKGYIKALTELHKWISDRATFGAWEKKMTCSHIEALLIDQENP